MTLAQLQGSLWGARARDYATLVETCQRPAYERVLNETGVGSGSRLLDVACGPGLAAQLAAARGAEVAGLDAAEASIVIARERVPGGDFRVGDMEVLPWADAAFDVVTSFNGFQFASDLTIALREAGRVTRPGGRVDVVVWGPADTCDVPPIMAAVLDLLPPQPASAQPSVPLSAPGDMELRLIEAGLTPLTSGQVDWSLEFPDLETAVRGLMSAGAAVAVVQRVGTEPVERTLREVLASFVTSTGGYRLQNRFHYVLSSA